MLGPVTKRNGVVASPTAVEFFETWDALSNIPIDVRVRIQPHEPHWFLGDMCFPQSFVCEEEPKGRDRAIIHFNMEIPAESTVRCLLI